MADNPTIIVGHLNDEELKSSINSLVSHVEQQTKKMTDTFDSAISRMKESLQSLGTAKVDMGGTSDGGATRRKRSQDAETQAVKETTQARKELATTLDQEAAAIQKATRMPSEMRMPDMAKSARESFQVFYKGFNEQARKLESLINATENKLASLGLERFSTETRSQLAQVDASIDQTRWKIDFLYQEEKRLNQEALRQKVSSTGFEQAWLKKYETKSARVREGERLIELEKERQRIIASDPLVQQLDKNIEQTRAKIQQLYTEEKRLHNESLKQTVGSSEFEKLWNQKYVVRDERIANEEKLIQLEKERQSLVAVDPIRTQLANIDELRAKHEKVLGLMRDETTTNNKVAQSQEQLRAQRERVLNTMKEEVVAKQQTTSASQQQVAEEQKITQQIKEQAKAIRESEEWQKKGRYTLADGSTIYNLEGSKKNRISVEEQILELQAREAMQAKINAQEQERVTQAVFGTYKVYENVHEMQIRANQALYAARQDASVGQQEREYRQLEKTVAQLLGVRSEELNLTTNIMGSYTALSQSLSIMTNAYREMSQSERESARGQELADKIQQTSRAAQEVQRQMNRPISLEKVLGFEPKTLDDMVYKMQRLQSYKQGIDLTKPNAANEIKQVDQAMQQLQKDMDKYMSRSKQVGEINTALARSWNYMKNRLAFYFTVGASTQFVKNLIEVRSQYEMNEKALVILIDSAERGSQIFKELSDMALVSPYTLIELSSAARQLTAYDVAAKDVVETTRRLADMSAAVGLPIERLTYALGQIKAYGYLNSRDARMFLNAGIPLVARLAEHYSELEGRLVSVGDVYDRIKKKAVGYNDVMQVINEMTDEGGRFFDFQAKMADTLKVKLANLTLAWNNMLNDIGQDTQGVLNTGIGALRVLFLHWSDINKLIKDFTISIGSAKLVQLGYYLWVRKTNEAIKLETVLGGRLSKVVQTVAASLKSLVTSTTAWFILFGTAAAAAVTTFQDARTAVKELNKAIRDGAKENFDSIQKKLDSLKSVRGSLYSAERVEIDAKTGSKTSTTIPTGRITKTDIQEEEAQNAWQQIREEIELTSKSSEYFIGKLLAIDDTNERVRKGFEYLENVRDLYGVLQDLGEDTIKVQQDFSKWWNLGLGSDSLEENLKDYTTALDVANGSLGGFAATMERIAFLATDAQRIVPIYKYLSKTLEAAFPEALGNTEEALERVKKNTEETAQSMANFLSGYDLNPEQWREAYEQMTQKIMKGMNLSQEEQLRYRLQQEESFLSERAKMFEKDREYIRQQNGKLTEEEIKQRLAIVDANEKAWRDAFGESRALSDAFYNNLRQQHRSEIDKMFGHLSEKELETLDESVPQWREWAMKNAKEFADRWRVSFDDLWGMINDTNKMKIFIKGTISFDDEEKEYDILTKADQDLKDANTRLKRLKVRLAELKSKGASLVGVDEKDKEYAKTIKEITQAEEDRADAIARGGREKEKANNAAKKDVLGDALSKEVQLIAEIQKRYKEYKKYGVDSQTALTKATAEYGNTLSSTSKTLRKYGILTLEPRRLASLQLQDLLNFYRTQMKVAAELGNTKGVEALEKAMASLNVEITKIDYKTITDGLNSELSKLKNEYELAVELDASPEFGGAFMELFDIDPNELPKNIDQYAERVVGALNKALEARKQDLVLPKMDLTRDDIEALRARTIDGTLDEQSFKEIEKWYKVLRALRKKDREETINKTRELQYKLADTNGKIAIENEKLLKLQKKLENETHEEKKRLLELEIQDQENAIEKLKEEILSELPTYKKLFNSIVDYSNGVSKRLAKNYLKILNAAKAKGKNDQGKYTITDDGITAEVSQERLNKEIEKTTKEIRKTEDSFKKIKEAFRGGENAERDWAKGLEEVAEEANKAADGIRTITEIVDSLGGSEDSVEILNDIATSMEGVATAAQGVAQFAAGDYIGGTVNIIKGIWQAISTWFNNKNKKIDRQIEESKFKVEELSLAYKKLEYAANKALGAEETVAKREAISVKEQELAELERQLALEQQKSYKKHSDKKEQQDRIQGYLEEIETVREEIEDAKEEIVNNLLGSDVKSAAENFVDTWVEAWRAGETTLDAIKEKMDDMIYSLIKKALASKIVEGFLTPLYEELDYMTSEESEGGAELTTNELRRLAKDAGVTVEEINTALSEFFGNLDQLDIISKTRESSKELSALQQGLQSMGESTANALEAYANSISQQSYYHSTLLEQIRDTIVGFDLDVSLGVQSQMLLQLQSSYLTQQAIKQILEGALVPSGRAFAVELLS